jgi:hypothetical protein
MAATSRPGWVIAQALEVEYLAHISAAAASLVRASDRSLEHELYEACMDLEHAAERANEACGVLTILLDIDQARAEQAASMAAMGQDELPF